MQQLALGEALETENAHVIHNIGLSPEDQVRDDLACRGRVHNAVSAEAVGQKEAWDLSDRAKNSVVIRTHFIKSGPAAFGIDGKIFEHRHAICRVHEHLLNKGIFEGRIEARSFLVIIPSQKKSASFRTEMEASRQINDHGRGGG